MCIGTRYQHAILTVLLLSRATEKPLTTVEMSKRLGISISYLEQIMSRLKRNCIVESIRGPGGGYRLSREPDDVSVGDILRSVKEHKRKPPEGRDEDLSGLWSEFSSEIWKLMESRTLGQLSYEAPVQPKG